MITEEVAPCKEGYIVHKLIKRNVRFVAISILHEHLSLGQCDNDMNNMNKWVNESMHQSLCKVEAPMVVECTP